MLDILEIIGVFFFCLSGALAARQMKFDPWGMFVLALITGTGGGTLRSILIGIFPVPIFRDPTYVIVSAVAVVCAVLFDNFWGKVKRHVSIIDAFGLGLFAGVGTQIALEANLEWWAAIGMAAVTATFGGVIRDIIRNDVPLVFRREIYATAALAGGAACVIGQQLGLGREASVLCSVFIAASIRLVALRFAINAASGTAECR